MLIELTDDFALFNSWVRLTTVFSEQADFTGEADCPQVDLLASFPSVGIQARAVPPPAIVNPTPVQGAAQANLAADLTELSNLYQRCHTDLATLETRFPELQFQGNAVLVAVEGQGDYQNLLGSLGG